MIRESGNVTVATGPWGWCCCWWWWWVVAGAESHMKAPLVGFSVAEIPVRIARAAFPTPTATSTSTTTKAPW